MRTSDAEFCAGPVHYSTDHRSVIYVMGPDGRFIAPLKEAAPKQMAADIAKLMS